MPSKNQTQYLRDIAENIDAVQEFLRDLDADSFLADRKTVYAVIRALEIISEASRRLPQNVEETYPEIDWHAIRAAGNVFRHEYHAVDERLIWQTARHELATLKLAVHAELKRSSE